MDKSNHRVTVDREYLEMLEDFYKANKDSGFNMYGKVMKLMSPSFVEVALFIDENEVTDKEFTSIIILDDKGTQKGKFNKI